ncbi:MAG TPA: phosphatidate cytidylyltransferase [Candidatus Competibacteraceae bacterium]|nr:phosphatidate cytidylyltransferase [Candidatus Competibacteraceae bacterium]
MLKQRVITALVLGSLAVWGVLALPPTWFALIILAVLLLGAWEWGGLLGLSIPIGRLIYALLLTLLAGIVWLFREQPLLVWILLAPIGLFWCAVLLWLWRQARGGQHPLPALAWELTGFAVLLPPFAALLALRVAPERGPAFVLFLLLLIWLADSVAYFAGRRWGKNKLAPAISPGKTREGALAALAAAPLFALVGAPLLGLPAGQWLLFMVICLVTVLFSIAGDLFESLIKRQHGAKDSGDLLPGHGGVLDRIDSLTAAAPIFVLALQGLPAR